MKKFIIKLMLFTIPILLLPCILFLIIDPFMLVGKNVGKIKTSSEYTILPNRDFQTTELFLKNYPTIAYNSFILGNSRSFFYQCTTWSKYINGECFHFNAAGENLFGIEGKLKFLSKKKVKIKNVLIIIDEPTLAHEGNRNGHLFIKHPEISNESYFKFYFEMLKGFFPKPLFAFLDLHMTGKRKEYMGKFGIRKNVWRHDQQTNQLTNFLYDSLLTKDESLYYNDMKFHKMKRSTLQLYSKQVIKNSQKLRLQNIYNILESNKTAYKIIVSPLYDQKKFNDLDLDYLVSLFGADKIYDFSGTNEFTKDYRNYYEASHYRPRVADRILERIY